MEGTPHCYNYLQRFKARYSLMFFPCLSLYLFSYQLWFIKDFVFSWALSLPQVFCRERQSKEQLPVSTGHCVIDGNIIPPSPSSPPVKSKIENWIDAVCPVDYLLPYLRDLMKLPYNHTGCETILQRRCEKSNFSHIVKMHRLISAGWLVPAQRCRLNITMKISPILLWIQTCFIIVILIVFF